MTLPRSRARAGAGLGDALVHEGLELVVGEGLGEVVAEDRDLRLLLRDEVVAAALREGLDALAAGLHLARDHADDLVVGHGRVLRLVGVVDRVLDHAQDVTPQRVTRPHRSGRVVPESFAKGHRMAPRASRRRMVY